MDETPTPRPRFRPPPLRRWAFVTAAVAGVLVAVGYALLVPGCTWQELVLVFLAAAVIWVGSVWLTNTGFAWRTRPRR